MRWGFMMLRINYGGLKGAEGELFMTGVNGALGGNQGRMLYPIFLQYPLLLCRRGDARPLIPRRIRHHAPRALLFLDGLRAARMYLVPFFSRDVRD